MILLIVASLGCSAIAAPSESFSTIEELDISKAGTQNITHNNYSTIFNSSVPVTNREKRYQRICNPNDLYPSKLCAQPKVIRNIFLYSAPKVPKMYRPTPPTPSPRVEYNLVFVRAPDKPQIPDPIVVPPPQKKTIVYVLNKENQLEQKVIEVPDVYDHDPEVFYVNYNEGDNPILPDGMTLEEALASAISQDGSLIGLYDEINDEPGGNRIDPSYSGDVEFGVSNNDQDQIFQHEEESISNFNLENEQLFRNQYENLNLNEEYQTNIDNGLSFGSPNVLGFENRLYKNDVSSANSDSNYEYETESSVDTEQQLSNYAEESPDLDSESTSDTTRVMHKYNKENIRQEKSFSGNNFGNEDLKESRKNKLDDGVSLGVGGLIKHDIIYPYETNDLYSYFLKRVQ